MNGGRKWQGQFPASDAESFRFASDCRETYKEFSVHIQRGLNKKGHPEIQNVLVTIKDVKIYLTHKYAAVDEEIVKTPHYMSGILIETSDVYTKVYARAGLVLMWNREDSLMLELDPKFNNHTCGLCGDYNGQQVYNEFISGDMEYNPITYGNEHKINTPNSICEDPDETQQVTTCHQHHDECTQLLTSQAFSDCHSRLNLEMYVNACMQDKCACQEAEDAFCLCSTISEYSRQCSHAGGRPRNWRTEKLCPKSCPGNMVYQESSSPCIDTCSHLEISNLCEEHYMDGCFCPEGTVYDDLTEKGCVAVNKCSCKLHGQLYSPGQKIANECEECTCDSGRWICHDLPCPGTCMLEGGSHITTFDGKKYIFHGECYYVLTKNTVNDSHTLLAELGPCSFEDKQTCLKNVVLLIDHKRNIVVFKADGTVLLNELVIHLPHVTASFSVFQPSSHYLVVHTDFGLRLQIQLLPVMQLFVIVNQTAHGKLQGLCGNFNGMEGDDFKTVSGLIEATGSAFANTWKAQPTCNDKVDRLEDPCTLSVESASYAEQWCSLLKHSESPFAKCHSVIDPLEYYKGVLLARFTLTVTFRLGVRKPHYNVTAKLRIVTITCQKGKWSCTVGDCFGTCSIYGNGHYITFDGKQYDFDGDCEYVAVQDYCGEKNSSASFSILTENVPCGTTGVTCSKAIKIFLGRTELKLQDKELLEIRKDHGEHVNYWTRKVGLYLVIEVSNGLMVIWDKKTTVFIKLTPYYKGKICGLCGNFDDKSNNDFTTRSKLLVNKALEFGNSWKHDPQCPDVTAEIQPCDVKPHRKSWSQLECRLIKSDTFKTCHPKVDPIPFYEACVHDACSCDSGGDCECFCSAVAAYAQECAKAMACVFWRTPDICPIFCDYYNARNECTWHYEPCGREIKTCKIITNPSTNFSLPLLEGCYPSCPPEKPIYDEYSKTCVTNDGCGCYMNETYYPPSTEIPTIENCKKCHDYCRVNYCHSNNTRHHHCHPVTHTIQYCHNNINSLHFWNYSSVYYYYYKFDHIKYNPLHFRDNRGGYFIHYNNIYIYNKWLFYTFSNSSNINYHHYSKYASTNLHHHHFSHDYLKVDHHHFSNSSSNINYHHYCKYASTNSHHHYFSHDYLRVDHHHFSNNSSNTIYHHYSKYASTNFHHHHFSNNSSNTNSHHYSKYASNNLHHHHFSHD
ncbi:hypothetical protein Y1Q_0000777 [Alligator mississippiensis]|uniref:VWFD domain-containing protein n=1 Tax=Alligator mississippiensis TaxID=8496 RepID=A0A151MCE9_ALLMI|nr:hypothetical protein Y1Q_0000777 [Alligator mississippiensis]